MHTYYTHTYTKACHDLDDRSAKGGLHTYYMQYTCMHTYIHRFNACHMYAWLTAWRWTEHATYACYLLSCIYRMLRDCIYTYMCILCWADTTMMINPPSIICTHMYAETTNVLVHIIHVHVFLRYALVKDHFFTICVANK